jgi:hypothetical protein
MDYGSVRYTMSEAMICPVCKNTVEASNHECAYCGFKLVGGTQEIDAPLINDIVNASVRLCKKPHLIVVKGPLEDEVFQLEPLPVTIGRDPSCDLFLNNMTVSRDHAVIEREGGKIIIRDEGSLNGTWVDGKVVERAELEEGSLVQIGTFTMRFSCN